MTDVVATPGHDETEVLRLTASLERGSEHPLGEAIVKGAEARKLALVDAEKFAAIPGLGVSGRIDGHDVLSLPDEDVPGGRPLLTRVMSA